MGPGFDCKMPWCLFEAGTGKSLLAGSINIRRIHVGAYHMVLVTSRPALTKSTNLSKEQPEG